MATSYVALGFSKSGFMRDSDVYACTSNNVIVRSRNTMGNTNADQPLIGVSDINVAMVDGRIECTFTRESSRNDGDDNFYNLRDPKKYYIIMSKLSGSLKPDGNIKYHTERVIGSETSFSEFTSGGSAVDRKLILQKAHGCLMMIAWIGLASIGITLARFFKPMWPDTQIFEKPVWFSFHRICMVLTFLCTVSAFVIIFISVEGFLEIGEGRSGLLRFLHAIFGTVVTCLAIINPIMAIFRPHPGEPRRPLFNWAHWAVGTSAHLIAMATICLALGYRSARSLINGLPDYLFWLVIGFIIFHIIVWILLHIKRNNILNRNSDASNDIPLQDKPQDSQDNLVDANKPTSKDTRIMTFLISVYVLVSLAIVVTVVINIALV
ncbi:putative ferric-chelate reductase 1 [Amphiura filiformis]|uniref:putative ferric-chelate reductase 1 n=1 Tax=Amphiura filiformis TaxID=82378 RepID=UPI003B21CD98